MRSGSARLRFALLAVIVACVNFDCTGSQQSAATSSPSSSQACAWPTLISVSTTNVGLPDSAASYWLDSFQVHGDLRIVLHGQYPDARYASISVYTSTGNLFTANGIGSDLTDYQTAPDAGSVNPWQQSGSPGGEFTVTLLPDVSAGQVNALPLAPTGTPDGTIGYIQYRVYLPAGGDFSRVVVPAITLQQGGTSTTLRTCSNPGGPAGILRPSPSASPQASATAAAVTPAQLQFFRPGAGTTSGGFPNADSGYLLAYLARPGADGVVVIEAKAPRASTGDHPAPWPAAGTDMRYWSMCDYLGAVGLPVVVNSLPDGTKDFGCRDDEQTKVNASGYYIFVLGAESQRAAIEGVAGVTFLPFSSTQTASLYLLLFRNMLLNSDFGFPIQRVSQDVNPAAAAKALGAYYPRAAKCTLTKLMTAGPAACLSLR
jgi:hypothetical protein